MYSINKISLILTSILLIIGNCSSLLFNDKEGLFLVPSVAFRDHSSSQVSNENTNWMLYNQGWYYEENPIQATLITKSLQLLMKEKVDKERVKLFTASGEDDKSLCIDGLNRAMCTKTDDEGRIKNTFTMSNDEIQRFKQPGGNGGQVLFQVSTPDKKLKAAGEVYLCDDNGISFISDIDDTIKITGVTSSTQTLINTFSGEYKPVEDMANAYKMWETKYNATFHYLTASPDQLYPFLKVFLNSKGFPSGSAHMRHFTWFDSNFIQFFMSANYIKSKTETLSMFMKNTVNRYFVLLGDVFQKDPDIYASIYQQYPDRILKIFIRKYNDDSEGQARLEKVFANIPRYKWATFETGRDLPADIYNN